MKKKTLKKLLKNRSKEIAELRADLRKAIDALPEGAVRYDLGNKYPKTTFQHFEMVIPRWTSEMLEKYGDLNFYEFLAKKEPPKSEAL